ncbi:MAG: hypothetical protein MK101_02130 [Phycisphaerales bacterium]|nr:hypothetical protein [Phycisphaerales bacterium]
MDNTTSSELTVKVGSGFLIRSALIAVLCLVLGLWGIWDYVVAIPNQALQYQRAEVARQFNRAVEPILNGSTKTISKETAQGLRDAIISDLTIDRDASLAQEVAGLHTVAKDAGNGDTEPSLSELGRLVAMAVQRRASDTSPKTPADTSTTAWLKAVGAMAAITLTPTNVDGSPHEALGALHNESESALKSWGDVQPPSKYDRPIQWLFILCLPFVPWYAWTALVAMRRTYRLDAEGTLHMPEGSWISHDIADIDMSRWMAKSKAWVVHEDGTRVLLDDYVFKGLHRIVGRLAAQRHPDDWTDEARPVKRAKASAPDSEVPVTGDTESPDDEATG